MAPLGIFFIAETGVAEPELTGAVASEGQNRTTVTCGYNCLCVETLAGLAVIDSGLGPSFPGYGPHIGAQVGKLAGRLVESGFALDEVAAVVFTHLHQDHVRGAAWSSRLTFGDATGFAHAAEISFWQGHAPSVQDRIHAESAREAIRLFGDRLRGFDYGVEILPRVRTVDAAGHTPGRVLQTGRFDPGAGVIGPGEQCAWGHPILRNRPRPSHRNRSPGRRITNQTIIYQALPQAAAGRFDPYPG